MQIVALYEPLRCVASKIHISADIYVEYILRNIGTARYHPEVLESLGLEFYVGLVK